MGKVKLKCVSIARDGGSKQYIPFDAPEPESIPEAKKLLDNAYYLDGGIGSPTRGKLFSKHPKNGGIELDINDFELEG